ncbi:MAG: hypothetical protein NTV46_16520 [Verrucomicrobia bacterium]|nr:hypothetical protein [Verrucomicrobiota bacterium]
MKLLLVATVALLLGAFAMSWKGMNKGVNNASPDAIERLKKQVTELRQEQDNLEIQRKLQQLKTTPAPTPASNAAEITAMKAQLAALKATEEKIAAEKGTDKRDTKVAQDEEGLLSQRELEQGDSELRRARMIGEALLIGRVKEYVEDAQFGGFITFEIAMPDQVQEGTILGITARPESSANSRCPKSPPPVASPTRSPASDPSNPKSATNSSCHRSIEEASVISHGSLDRELRAYSSYADLRHS